MGCMEAKHHIRNAMTAIAGVSFLLRRGRIDTIKAAEAINSYLVKMEQGLCECDVDIEKRCHQCLLKWMAFKRALLEEAGCTRHIILPLLEKYSFG